MPSMARDGRKVKAGRCTCEGGQRLCRPGMTAIGVGTRLFGWHPPYIRTAPSVSPRMMYLWNTMTNSSTGIVPNTAAANMCS